ncbi:Dynein light chain [Tulasnella sp. 330]|nr:Dynein light chain [Tulasnella sp. 330]KAG8872426.1 Dynein light chain [Tulasnella sp. 331]KAG8880120.1 Dynein light chain [Tulasnella sp. 332]
MDTKNAPTSGTPSDAGATAVTTKATIKNVDMTEEMQAESIDIALKAMEQFQVEKDIAAHCKREFDKKYGPTWHVVVGKNFGSYVTHGKMVVKKLALLSTLMNIHSELCDALTETKHFIYFYVGPLALLIWKS